MLAKINHFLAAELKGWRTFLAAFAVAAEPLLESAITSHVDFGALGRQLTIAAVIAALRLVTNTPPGKKG